VARSTCYTCPKDGLNPGRAAFSGLKASEVCDIAKVQPFILRSWEKEFPDLGVAKTPGAARLYRRGDVQRVLQIKDLLFVEGLTLAGARRRLEGDKPEPPTEIPEPDEEVFVTSDVRVRLGRVKAGLRGLLALLDRVARGDGLGAVQDSTDDRTTDRSKPAAPQEFSLTEPVRPKPASRETPRRAAARPSRTPSPPAGRPRRA
jgi:DNA-binding transcriptional MerR regulator